MLETSCDRSSYAFQYRVYSVTYLPFTFPSEEVIWGCQLVGEESGTMRGGDGSDMGWTLEDRA